MSPRLERPLPCYPDNVQTTSVDGRRIAFLDRGDGPVLLFVHGLGSNLSLWRHTFGAFADTHRVVALDLPGFGESSKGDVPATMSFFADTLAAFLDARDIDRATVVGISMGGQIGVVFALRFPHRLDRLALVSPSGIESFTESEASSLRSLMTPEAIVTTSARRIRQNVALNFHVWSDEYAWLVEQRTAMAQRSDFPEYAVANARAVAGMLEAPVRSRLAGLSAPTLLVFGANDQLIPNPYLHPEESIDAVARVARERLPHAHVHMVPQSGHLVMIERPAVFHKKLRSFLNA